MDFSKSQNHPNPNRKMTMLMRDDDHGSDGEDEEAETMERDDIEEKKQKRAGSGRRVGGGGANSVSCQAHNCTADLTDAKRYHRRHKVCELHAKAPSVLVSGFRQRFCQQCSRFHELAEFDEAKRSCRRRLAGHNERRRKSSSEMQGEGGSSRPKAPSPQCKPGDTEKGSRAQMPSYAAANPTYKQYHIR